MYHEVTQKKCEFCIILIILQQGLIEMISDAKNENET